MLLFLKEKIYMEEVAQNFLNAKNP
jgi:hypothetical protein